MEETKEAIKELLGQSLTTSSGGYIVEFGPVLYSKLVKLSGYIHQNQDSNNSGVDEEAR